MSEREHQLEVARDAEIDGRWDDAMRLRIECAERWPAKPSVEIGSEDPRYRNSWEGKLVSLDGCNATDFNPEDVVRVIAYGETPQDWDGEGAGLAQLRDGRFIAWESTWGPTGSGFSQDAYGGDADIGFASTPGPALSYLSERARELLRWA